jgi:ribosomal protein S18 acetylase RimI-like enzyme
MRTRIVKHYLEITDPGQLRPARPVAGMELLRAEHPCPELNRFFYTAVGGDWYWLERLPWAYEQWRTYLDRPEHETWFATLSGTPAGYFELETRPETGAEIAYFGLLPWCIGRGLGGRLLTAAVERAFARGAARVWLHTCSLDHPAAEPNYLARGFRVYREEVYHEDLPDRSPGPWPGADRTASPDGPR